jgi:hypothetical protein
MASQNDRERRRRTIHRYHRNHGEAVLAMPEQNQTGLLSPLVTEFLAELAQAIARGTPAAPTPRISPSSRPSIGGPSAGSPSRCSVASGPRSKASVRPVAQLATTYWQRRFWVSFSSHQLLRFR